MSDWQLRAYNRSVALGGTLYRPPDVRRAEYVERLGVQQGKPRRLFTQTLMDRLDRCKDDEARKVLLGIRA